VNIPWFHPPRLSNDLIDLALLKATFHHSSVE
jgi:hypothetical protein